MNFRKHLIPALVLSFTLCGNLIAQGILNPDWTKVRSGAIGGSAHGWGVDVGPDGNVYWPYSTDSLGQWLDLYCLKLDSNGNALWATPFFYGGPGRQQPFICNASDTALYIGGKNCPFSANSCDMELLKVDKSSGTMIWSKTQDFGNNGYDELDGLEITDDGIYCGGWSQAIQSGPYQTDIGLWKVDFTGTTQWTNYFGKAGTAEHQDGHFVVDDDFVYAAGLWDGQFGFNLYNGSSFLGKFSKTDGSFIDSTLFGFQSNAPLDIENAFGMTSDGTYLYITGYSTPVSAFNWQIFLAKFDKNLNQIWFKDWGGSGQETARGITVEDGKVFIAGTSSSPGFNPAGQLDAVLLVYDTAGTFLSAKSWGDSLDNEFRDVSVAGNNIYLSGSSGNNLGQGDNDSAFVMKVSLGPVLTGLSQAWEGEISVQLYPNPCTTQLNIKMDEVSAGPCDFRLFDLSGRLVFQEAFQGTQKTFTFDLPGGVYGYEVVHRNTRESFRRGRVIIQRSE